MKKLFRKSLKKIGRTKLRKTGRNKAISREAIVSKAGTRFAYRDNPVPLRHKLVMRYAETISLTSAAATGNLSTQQLWSLNSIWDCNYTGTGHQPYGHDQMAALYTRYRVDKVDVEIMAMNCGGSNDMCICSGVIQPHGYQSMSGLTVDFATEHPNITTAVLSATGNTRVSVQKFTIDIAKALGLTKAEYKANNDYIGVFGANPSLTLSLGTAVGTYGAVSQAANVQVNFQFHVECFEPLILAQS